MHCALYLEGYSFFLLHSQRNRLRMVYTLGLSLHNTFLASLLLPLIWSKPSSSLHSLSSLLMPLALRMPPLCLAFPLDCKL